MKCTNLFNIHNQLLLICLRMDITCFCLRVDWYVEKVLYRLTDLLTDGKEGESVCKRKREREKGKGNVKKRKKDFVRVFTDM